MNPPCASIQTRPAKPWLLLPLLLLLTHCGGSEPPPPDFTPIGEGLRFLGVCGVLAMVVFSLARLVEKLRE